jgi:hypothetical protein
MDRLDYRLSGCRSAAYKKPTAGGWSIDVLPGLVRPVWLTWKVDNLEPGVFKGEIVVRSDGKEISRLPITLTVYSSRFPKQATLLTGGWDYLNNQTIYGVTEKTHARMVEVLKNHFVNGPWATRSVVTTGLNWNEDGTVQMDTRPLDRWIDEWPNAKIYCINLGHNSPFQNEGDQRRSDTCANV